MTKVIVASLTADDLSAIHELSRAGDREIIAVALDFAQGPGLRALHDAALGAGATRCHALDVREEYARECILPAIDADTAGDAAAELASRTREFVARKLAAVAVLEGDADLLGASRLAKASTKPTAGAAPHDAARVSIAFDAGVPRSVNEIPMTVSEVVESLGTIAAAHGIHCDDAALRVLHAAHRALVTERPARTGSTRLLISRGEISVQQPEYAAP